MSAILTEIYTENLFEKIAELNRIDNIESINSIEDLILFKRIFEVNRMPYKPSNGESAMILLLQELSEDKDILMSILAHDLITPFNSMLGFLDLLSENLHEYDVNTLENYISIVSG